MVTKEPVAERNLDGYGAPPIPWARAREGLEKPPGMEDRHWLATVRPDGRPHVMPVGAVWLDGAMYFTSGASTRKGRNLAHNAHCVITFVAEGIDLVVEGKAVKVRDAAKLQRLADVYASHGWPATARDGTLYADYSAPSAGPPPWDLYEVVPETIFGVGTAPGTGASPGATRWDF
jgi:hypothetical protein